MDPDQENYLNSGSFSGSENIMVRNANINQDSLDLTRQKRGGMKNADLILI